MAEADYETGAVKQNPETLAVAVRTVFPGGIPALADRQWGVMTVDNGGHYSTYDRVANWPDATPGEPIELPEEGS